MPYLTFLRAVLGAIFVLLLQLAPVQAQTLRFVSMTGSNTSGCGAVGSPCRSLQFIHDEAPSGAKIIVLDSGEFGVVTIEKSTATSRRTAHPRRRSN